MLSWIEIDAARLRSNLDAFRGAIRCRYFAHGRREGKCIRPRTRCRGPVAAERADWLGVNCVDEALAITRLGIEKPIAILGHTPLDQLEAVARNGYRQVLYRLDVAKALV